jgi:hypothetical protein
MQPPTPPKVTGVEVETAEPNEADSAAIAQLSADTNRSLPQVAQVVKVRFRSKPPVTSMAWALYVNDVIIPKYWEYEDGIYFTVLDPQFLSDHKGEPLRFSQNGVDFFDTGAKLPGPTAPAPAPASKPKGKPAKARKAAKASKGKSIKAAKSKSSRSSKRKSARSAKGKVR